MVDRIGDWMQTASGKRFYPLDPRPEEVSALDIVHALSHVCRFGGASKVFYSVAEHSVRVSRLAEEEAQRDGYRGNSLRLIGLSGLMHDAAEAYVGDMVRPLKVQESMAPYREVELAIHRAIAEACGFPSEIGSHVREADDVLLATEARDLMGGECAGKWHLRAEPLEETIEPWAPEVARITFLARYGALGGKPW